MAAMSSRRDFLRSGLRLGGAAVVASWPAPLRAQQPAPTRRSLKLLVLGGTGFIGPHLVRLAVSRGHQVTIFTRGRRKADLPDSVTRLVGDRNGQLDALKGARWDVVIDDSATNPEWVRLSTDLLSEAVQRYLFTSSTGVYYPYLKRGYDESDAPHVDLADPKDGSETFGVNKARCEQQVTRVFGDRGVIVRPTYIVGPGDTTDRFPYWPVRLARGGEVLAPGKADDQAAFVDVRDLAEFMLRLVEDGRSGPFNVVGPATPMTTREFYRRAQAAINPSARLTFVDDYELLASHGVESAVPWVMLRGNDVGHQSIRNDKAVKAGLTFRPVEDSLKDTLAWWPSTPDARRAAPKFEIPAGAEEKVLAAWASRRAG
jgi:2'-hydroxyisoflavone reductase